MRLHRREEFGLTTLELRGPDSELQLRLISRMTKKERRAFVRGFLVQIRPWLRHFQDPIIDHTGRGLVRDKPVGRCRVKVFRSNSVSTLSGMFGSEIRRKRTELGLSQSELARRLEIQRSHLSDLERGVYLPHPKTRQKIESELRMGGVKFEKC
jgi:DNA-binding transcriptional regulator YiaG